MIQGYKQPSPAERGFLKKVFRLTPKRSQRFYMDPSNPEESEYQVAEALESKKDLLRQYPQQFRAIERKRRTVKAKEALESYNVPSDVAKMVGPYIAHHTNPQVREINKYGDVDSYPILAQFRKKA